MKDHQAAIRKLREGAAEAALIRDLSDDIAKRELFDNLQTHLDRLANEIERSLHGETDEDHVGEHIRSLDADPRAGSKENSNTLTRTSR